MVLVDEEIGEDYEVIQLAFMYPERFLSVYYEVVVFLILIDFLFEFLIKIFFCLIYPEMEAELGFASFYEVPVGADDFQAVIHLQA